MSNRSVFKDRLSDGSVKIMGASIGTSTANTIVDTDTLELVSEADNIVRSCSGTNCNFSSATQTQITQKLSTTAQEQADATLLLFSIPNNSVVGRNIYNGYLNLGSAVSSTYNYQCGATTVNSVNCVTSASSVQAAQNNLQSLLTEPAINNTNHIIILSILFGIAVIAFILFFVFLIIGLFEFLVKAPFEGAKYMQTIQQTAQANQQPTITVTKVATPASPFETTEPIYE
ncbi:Hypothetical protein HVR_LOCUS1083 [uncultured virus]|nr:Hypothetical protein HVR_LOCUS1083 [uncultured virus]